MNKTTDSPRYNKDRYLYWFAIIGWSFLITCSFAWNSWSSWQGMLDRAISECKIALMKDMSYRLWSSQKGGVYVPVSEDTPPNPYLDVPNRDVTTNDGQELTLVNPAYMTRQVFSLMEEMYGLKGHITSLNFFNPDNAPDEWERKVLMAVEPDNPADVFELTQVDDEYAMRLLHPMLIRKSCLKCHGDQAYKVGDVRGGISFTLPITHYMAAVKKTILLLALVHVAFLVFGIGILKMLQNMSDARKFREELEGNEERLRTLINSTPDCILFKDGQGRWIESNLANLELFHLTDTDYQGRKDFELADDTHPMFREAFLGCEKTDEEAWKKGELSRCVEVIPRTNGSESVYDVIKVPLFHQDGSRKGLIIFGRDITEQKQLRDKLLKAEKMEAIGLMAGGVAHDLNNILSGIVSYPELILMDFPDDSKHRKMLRAIHTSGVRAADVVADLLTVARGVAAPRKIENLNHLILEYLKSPELTKLQSLHADITFGVELDENLANFSCSSVHVRKCLMNLATNAAEAIEGKGTVIFVTENRHIDEQAATSNEVRAGQYVVLRVIDSGSGIADNDLAHIFDPFYSKKVMGRSGTGLGLAVVWNTVHDHDGIVSVISDDRGTVFELCFPASADELVYGETGIDLENLKGHGESILVVDDEDQPRDIARQMLGSLDYKVEVVSSGEDAVDWLAENRVDLVMLDMIMPLGMDGCQTYEKIILVHPGQKAIIVSGYADDEAVRKARKLGVGKFVKKPYSLSLLGLAVKEILKSC